MICDWINLILNEFIRHFYQLNMKIISNGIEPQFKIYKMSENIEGKVYIGKTKRPLQERINGHRSSKQYADKHFSNVGWNNVLVEIIDTANNDEELSKKRVYQD